MPGSRTHHDDEQRTGTDRRTREEPRTSDEQPTDARTTVRWFGVVNVAGGVLGLLGPAVWENDDDGLVNVATGRFLGLVAVNGPHAMLHVLIGALGLRASTDAASARRYVGLVTAFFGAMAAMGWRQFGFEPGVHEMGGLAVDRWANVGHTLIAALGVWTLLTSGSES